jgi:hypothetical protein
MQNEVQRRKINYLWHFTRIENLESILMNGLIPRANLERGQTQITYNDQYRFDGQKNANCLSIGHPNYKMFYSLRCQEPQQDWVVLAINPEVLWTKDCAFCHENAASNNVTCIPIQNRKGIQSFRKLFDEVPGKPSRSSLKLPDNCPTNPQAEILVFGVIEPIHIVGSITPTKAIETDLKVKYPDFEFLYHRAHYGARLDYEHW